MNKFLLLLKKDVINDFSFIINYRQYRQKKSIMKTIGLIFLLIYAVAVFAFVSKAFLDMYDTFAPLGFSKVFIFIPYFASIMMIVIFGIAEVFSKLFFTNDNEFMLSLPLKKSDIYRSKILNFSFYNSIFSIFIVLPSLIKFGVAEHLGVLYYIEAILSIPVITIFYMSLLSFLIVLIMRVVSPLKSIKYIVQTFGLFFAIGVSVFISQGVQGIFMSPLNLANNVDMISKKFGIIFLPLNLLLKGLTEGDFISYALFVLISILSFYLITEFQANMLFTGIFRMGVSVNKKKKVKIKYSEKKSKITAIAIKELREIIKTPIYFFNMAAGGILLPVILIISYVKADIISIDSIKAFYSTIDPKYIYSFAVMLGVFYSFFIGGVSQSAASSFSREGKYIWQLKVFPLKATDILFGKLVPSLVFQGLSLLFITVSIFVLFRPPVIAVIIMFLSGIATDFMLSNLGFLLDIRRPRLKWENPQQAVKNNFAIIAMSIISMVIFFSVFIFFMTIGKNISINSSNLAIIATLLFIAMSGLGIALMSFNIKTCEESLKKL